MNIINNIISDLMKNKNDYNKFDKEEEYNKFYKKEHITKKKIIEIHGDSDLPKKGWIQGCYACDLPTSRTCKYINSIIKNKHFDFYIYICKDCKKINVLNEIKVKNKLNKYILNKFLH